MQSMNAKDEVRASLAACFVTIEGNRYNFMQAINLAALSLIHISMCIRDRDWSMPGYPGGDVFRPQRNASPGEGQRRAVQI